MDLYRIKSIEEAIDAGIEDCLESKNLCLVEWPEKARLLFPGETVYVSLQTVSNNVREIDCSTSPIKNYFYILFNRNQ